MNGFRGTQRLSFAAATKKEPGAAAGTGPIAAAKAPAQSVSTSRFRALLTTTDKSKFAAETGVGVAGTNIVKSSPVDTSVTPSSVPQNVFDMPAERGVTAVIPYNHNSARPSGTALFLHGRIEDTRVFGRAPHLRYLDMEEGVRLPQCLTEKIQRVVRATSTKFDQSERHLPVTPDVCFYDTYEIPITDEVMRCPVDFNGKVMTVTGTFCSEACVLAYLRDGRGGVRAQQHGATWLAALRRWRNCLGQPLEAKDHFIDPALHYSVLQRFGGPMSIEDYRSRGEPRSTYRRHITYVFPQHFRVVPSGYIHVREDRAQPPQQHTARSVITAPTPSLPSYPQIQPTTGSWHTPTIASTPIPPPTPFCLPPASPLTLSGGNGGGAAVTPAFLPAPSPTVAPPPATRRRLKRRIETSDDEGGKTTTAATHTSPRNDYYRIRRIEQHEMGRRKRHYQTGDADINYRRKPVTRRRKKAVGKQLSEPQGMLKAFFGKD